MKQFITYVFFHKVSKTYYKTHKFLPYKAYTVGVFWNYLKYMYVFKYMYTHTHAHTYRNIFLQSVKTASLT